MLSYKLCFCPFFRLFLTSRGKYLSWILTKTTKVKSATKRREMARDMRLARGFTLWSLSRMYTGWLKGSEE